jgi:hypothetical protein
MNDRTDELSDATGEHAGNGDGTAMPPEPAPGPDEQLAEAAAAAAPYSTLTPPPRPRRNTLGRMVWLTIGVAAVVLVVAYGPGFKQRLEELRVQAAAAEYVPANGQAVYEEQPVKASILLATGGGYFEAPRASGGPGDGGPAVAAHAPAAWRAYRRWAFAKSPEPPGALLFLHERQTAVGVRGIVAVEADRAARRLRVSFIRRGTYTSDPAVTADGAVKPPPKEGMIVLSSGRDPFESKLPPDPAARADLRFFAGRPDPQDWTHFVIPYELDGYAGELEMWVADEATFHYVDRRFAKR